MQRWLRCLRQKKKARSARDSAFRMSSAFTKRKTWRKSIFIVNHMDSRPFLRLSKETAFTLSCCNRPQAFLINEENLKHIPLGRLTNPSSLFLGSCVEIFNELQEILYTVEPGCCQCLGCGCCGCCGSAEMKIMNEKRSRVGRIIKKKGGNSCSPDPLDAEYTLIEFPLESKEHERALILSAALFYHQIHFSMKPEISYEP